MFNILRLSFSGGLLFLLMLTGMSHAASPYGTWVRDNGVHIKVFRCENGLGMKIVKATKKINIGKRIMCGAEPISATQWDGEILNVSDNRTYSGTVTIKGNKLRLKGCVFGGLICKEDEWQRLK